MSEDRDPVQNGDSGDGISRRQALKVIAAATAFTTAPSCAPGTETGENTHESLSISDY